MGLWDELILIGLGKRLLEDGGLEDIKSDIGLVTDAMPGNAIGFASGVAMLMWEGASAWWEDLIWA